MPQWESSPARARVGPRWFVGSVQVWASSGHCLVTHSPGSQRVKPGETLGSQGPEGVSRERWEAVVFPPLCQSWSRTPCHPHCQQLSTQLLRRPH